MEGRSLYEEFLYHGAFTEQQMSSIVKQIIQYLSILHQHSMYHSDVKPSNILIAKTGGSIVGGGTTAFGL